MKAKELTTIWGAPEPPRLTPKQLSIRLPILVSAKISALCELFTKKTKTDIIGDLLNTALDELEKELPMESDEEPCDFDAEEQKPLYRDVGIRGRFFTLTEKYLRELEKEAGVVDPMEFSYKSEFYDYEFE